MVSSILLPILLLLSLGKASTMTPNLNFTAAEENTTSTPASSTPLDVNDPNQQKEERLARILVTLPVFGTDSLNNTIYCVQPYGGFLTPQDDDTPYTSDEFLDFEDNILGHSSHTLPDIHIEGLRPFRVRCGMYRFKDFPLDLMVVFPGGDERNCTEHTSYCKAILAKRSGTSFNLGLSNCYDLYVGRMKIPEEEHLKRNGTMVLEDASHVGETCNPMAFMDLIQGNKGVDEVLASEGAGSDLKLNIKKKILKRLQKRDVDDIPFYPTTEAPLDDIRRYSSSYPQPDERWARGVVFNKSSSNRTTATVTNFGASMFFTFQILVGVFFYQVYKRLISSYRPRIIIS